MYLLFDIGGTKMRLATSTGGEAISEPVAVPTPASAAELVETFRHLAESLLGGTQPEAIAGGLTRRHAAARAGLERLWACPSYIANDAALGALGEARSGAGKNFKIASYFTISTGVGGARVVEGKLDAGESWEPGHQVINQSGPAGQQTLEELVSGTSLAERLGRPAREVTDPAVWDELARLLALGLRNSALHWSPEVVVLGGAMMLGEPRISLARVGEYWQALSTATPALPPPPALALAALGDASGLRGALHFLQDQLRSL